MSFPFCGACVCVCVCAHAHVTQGIEKKNWLLQDLAVAHRICVATCGILDAAGRIWFPNCGLNPGSLVLGG